MTLILGIESSCDETSAALVRDGKEVIALSIAAQEQIHQKYGGVVPELAARAHIENIIPVIKAAMDQGDVTVDDIDAISVANCPGLTPSLLIGVTAAKTLAWAWDKPLVAVNHVHGHLQSVMLDEEKDCFPAIALIVSGGHTSLYDCKSLLELELIGSTVDDAAGEAFDKVAMILKLPYPGGPQIEKLARDGDPNAIKFPRSLLGKGALNFSFSGLKTAVLYHCRGQDMLGADQVDNMTEKEKADVAASFQAAVVDVLTTKAIWAMEQMGYENILLGGGVAANTALREELQAKCQQRNWQCIISPRKYCTDNAAMVAGLGFHKFKAGLFVGWELEASSSSK
ncbi:MAG: tRNA (adenosine(37)-N6)-threonylcarbamoyltransferase complex transferase subunit TsaD [Phycisphaerae bacterium]|nr:tRNA (adenosine(37)-N6)-threonylcarbamoyltransferase complex transferase subunit TsaD [Phycisphaerae bacterium]